MTPSRISIWKKFFAPVLFIFLTSYSVSALGELMLARNAILDATEINLNEVRLPLNGQWHYFEGQLIQPGDEYTSDYVIRDFPGLWEQSAAGKPGWGHATYTLKIILSHGYRILALELPQVYSSYDLWINGELIAGNGKVGTTKESSVPQWLPQTIPFEVKHDTLQLVLHISNFQHAKGGINQSIYLGAPDIMVAQRYIAVNSNLIEFLTLLIISLFFLAIYVMMKDRKKIVLYFALMCLTWAIRSVFSNLYIGMILFPNFDWNYLVRIEYITLFFTMIWAILFLNRIFIKEGNQIVIYLFVIVNAFFTVLTLISAPSVFTRFLSIYLTVAGGLLIYGFFVVMSALVNDRVGAKTLVATVMLGIFIFAYDILAYKDYFKFNSTIFSAGYIAIFLLMSFALMLHLNIIKGKPKPMSMLRYEDLYPEKK